MITRLCDRCGQPIEEGALRYEAKIHVFAAYDPLNITFEDLEKDHTEELKRLQEECRELSETELMEGVYVDFHFDLCPLCQKSYIKDPLFLQSQQGEL